MRKYNINDILSNSIFGLLLFLVFVFPIIFITDGTLAQNATGDETRGVFAKAIVLCGYISCNYDLPKILLVRLVASSILVLMILKWFVMNVDVKVYGLQNLVSKTIGIVTFKSFTNIYFLINLCVIALCVIMFISSLISLSISSSLWGRVPLADGTSLYNLFSIMIIFVAIVSHINSMDKVKWLLLGIMSTGCLVSIIGLYEFYSQIDSDNLIRINSTTANPIVLASFLVFSIGISFLMLCQLKYNKVLTYALTIFVLAVQIWALLLTQSRGPIISITMLLIVLGSIYLFKNININSFKHSISVIVSIAIPIAILTFSAGYIQTTGDVLSSQSNDVIGSLQSRFSSVSESASAGGIQSRIWIWSDSVKLMTGPEQYDVLQNTNYFTRLMFGYGMDTFPLISSISASPIGPEQSPQVYLYAHNVLIHWLVEIGVLGLLLNLAIIIMVLFLAAKTILYGTLSSGKQKLIILMLSTILVFNLIDQLTNVMSVGDLLFRWIILGIVFKLCLMVASNNSIKKVIPQINMSHLQGKLRDINVLSRFGVVLVIVVTVIGFTWVNTINYGISAFQAGKASEFMSQKDYAQAYSVMDKALSLSPRSFAYYHWASEALEGLIVNGGTYIECSLDGSSYGQCVSSKLFELDDAATRSRPLESTSHIQAANSSLKLYAYDPEYKSQFISSVNKAALLAPQNWKLRNWIALGYLQLGSIDSANQMLTESIEITGATKNAANAVFLEGLIHQQRGQFDDAILKYTYTIELSQDESITFKAFNNRGLIYRNLSNYDKAKEDFENALDIDGFAAEVHNNLGGLYLDNARFPDALSSFSRSIYADENYGPAYYNRSLIFAGRGDREDAINDLNKANSLGMDVKELRQEIERMLKAYADLNSGS